MRILFLLFFCSFTGADLRVNEKILGGHNCKEDEAQYYVAVCKGQCDKRMDIICGGTLIRPDWVLTAARCDLPLSLSPIDPLKYPLFTDKLQCVTINLTKCPENLDNNPKYSKNRFCAGGGGKATRPGDSGGGLVINSTVYGIVHRGNNIDTAGNTPGIYINVCAFRDWIMKTAV
ncbi:kallikrein-14-like [Arapaima gigas]